MYCTRTVWPSRHHAQPLQPLQWVGVRLRRRRTVARSGGTQRAQRKQTQNGGRIHIFLSPQGHSEGVALLE